MPGRGRRVEKAAYPEENISARRRSAAPPDAANSAEIFTIARLPAAKMLTSGEKLSMSGKFHGTMTPTDAERLRNDDIARARVAHPVDTPPARLDPAFQALARVVDRVDHLEDFGERRLERASIAIIPIDGGDDGLGFLNEATERLQIREPLRQYVGSHLSTGRARCASKQAWNSAGMGEFEKEKRGRVRCLPRGRGRLKRLSARGSGGR